MAFTNKSTPMDMSLALAASHEASPPAQRMTIAAILHAGPDGDTSRDHIRQLFHSPLGLYVSHASRDHTDFHIEFDVASEDLAFTLRTLKRVLPDAAVTHIRPRVFIHHGRP